MNFIIPEYPSNWDEIRKEVLELDQYTCQSCRGKSRRLHIHHITPLSERGTNDAYNLVTLCEECFQSRHPGTIPVNVKQPSYLYCEKCNEKYSHETGLYYCPECESFLTTYVEPTREKIDHRNSNLIIQHVDPYMIHSDARSLPRSCNYEV